MPSYTTPASLKARGLDIVRVLTATKDIDAMAEVLSPDIEARHGDEAAIIGLEKFLPHWKVLLEAVPNLSCQVYDSVAEVRADGSGGGKVWVFSRISGLPDGSRKDSVDMLEIDGNGLLAWIKDVQRDLEL